jgi:hypothetical protein
LLFLERKEELLLNIFKQMKFVNDRNDGSRYYKSTYQPLEKEGRRPYYQINV